MRYKIKRIKSREKLCERIAIVLCITLYFLLLAISEYYQGATLPEWIFEIQKKLPM